MFIRPLHASTISGPSNGTAPNERAAVSCSERCSSGLPPASSCSGVSKFGGIWLTHPGGSLSSGISLVKRYHQATSWGLTSETVVHHGPLPDSWSNQSSNWSTIVGSTSVPCPGAPLGEG